jgi:hypothetical protein
VDGVFIPNIARQVERNGGKTSAGAVEYVRVGAL